MRAVPIVIKRLALENLWGYAKNFVKNGIKNAKMNGFIHILLNLLKFFLFAQKTLKFVLRFQKESKLLPNFVK